MVSGTSRCTTPGRPSQLLRSALAGRFRQIHTVVLPDGEAYKTWETLNTLFDQLLGARCERKTTLIALGGGEGPDKHGWVPDA